MAFFYACLCVGSLLLHGVQRTMYMWAVVGFGVGVFVERIAGRYLRTP